MDNIELVSNGFKMTSYKRRLFKKEKIKRILYINWEDIDTIIIDETTNEDLVSITIITKLGSKYLIYKNNFEYDLDLVVMHIIEFKKKENLFRVIFFNVDELLETISY